MEIKYKFMTIKEVAEKLLKLKENETIDFTFDNSEEDFRYGEPSEWWGLKKINLFDEPHGNICMGYYGGYETKVYSIFDYEEECEKVLQEWFDEVAGVKVNVVCVEIK